MKFSRQEKFMKFTITNYKKNIAYLPNCRSLYVTFYHADIYLQVVTYFTLVLVNSQSCMIIYLYQQRSVRVCQIGDQSVNCWHGLNVKCKSDYRVQNDASLRGQLSLPSLRGRLIEYRSLAGVKAGCVHLCRVEGNIV